MNRSSLATWFEIAPVRVQVARRMRLFNLLARPAMDDESGRQTRRLIESQQWRPLDPLRLHREMLPLFAAHLQSMGIEWTRFSRESPPDLQAVARQHFARAASVRSILKALGDGNAGPVVLIKGIAIAAHYPSPALRTMCDLDLLIDRRQQCRAGEILRKEGWQPSRQIHGVFLGPSGQRLDLQMPDSRFAQDLMDRAAPSPLWPFEHVRVASPMDLAVLTAHHAAQHLGERIWRDVCDWRALGVTEEDMRGSLIGLSRGSSEPILDTVEAFLIFLQRLELRQIGAKFPPISVDGQVGTTVLLFEHLARLQTHPAALHLMRRMIRPWNEHLRGFRLRRSLIPEKKAPGLDTPPAQHLAEMGGISRLGMALWVLLGLAWHGILGSSLRITRLQRGLSSLRNPFTSD